MFRALYNFFLLWLWLNLIILKFSSFSCNTTSISYSLYPARRNYNQYLKRNRRQQTIQLSKDGCNTTCGNLKVPYPFGISLDGKCSLNKYYIINCNSSYYDPPKPFLGRKGNLEVLDISINGQLRISNFVASSYVQQTQGNEVVSQSFDASVDLAAFPIVFSDTENKLIVVGCDDYALVYGLHERTFTTGCVAGCSNLSDVIDGSCSGMGCCQISIPKGLKSFKINLRSLTNHTHVSHFNSYAFLAEQDKFIFNANDLKDPNFRNKTKKNVPVVIDWFVGMRQNCVQAKENKSSYACQTNTKCNDFNGGYRCSCLQGYEGNPYLSPGCTG